MDTAVWFDIDRTILRYDRTRTELFEEVVPDAPREANETFKRGVLNSFDNSERNSYVVGFERVRREHDVAVDPDKAADAYATAERDATILTDRTIETLRDLNRRTYVGILTNGDPEVQHQKLAHHGIDGLFEDVILSTEVGASKPDAELFEQAFTTVDADRHVYVGDDYRLDIAPTRDLDFTPIHVRNDDGPQVSLRQVEDLPVF